MTSITENTACLVFYNIENEMKQDDGGIGKNFIVESETKCYDGAVQRWWWIGEMEEPFTKDSRTRRRSRKMSSMDCATRWAMTMGKK